MLIRPDDPIVIVPADVAAEMVPYVRRMAAEASRDGTNLRARTVTVLDELVQAATVWASARRRAEPSCAEVAAPSDPVREIPTSEAASRLGVCPRRVGQLVHSGALQGRKVGRVLLVDVVSVEARIAQRREA